MLTYMSRSIQVEVPPNERARDSIVEGSLVALDEAHGGKLLTQFNAGQ
jgi:hypothetical protein